MVEKAEKKKGIISRIISALIWIILVLLCALVVFILYSNVTGKAPMIFGYGCFNIATGSMEPNLKVGSYIIVKDVNPDELKENDIISFYSENEGLAYGKPVTHRIVEVKTENGVRTFITKGDANPLKDKAPVTEEKIIGKYMRSVNLFSEFGKLLSNPVFYLVIVVIPAIILFVIKVRSAVEATKDYKRICEVENELKAEALLKKAQEISALNKQKTEKEAAKEKKSEKEQDIENKNTESSSD